MGDDLGPAGEAELREIRRRIDELDRRIVELLGERTELARRIGEIKEAAGRRIRDAEREREILLRVTMANAGPLAQADLIAIYERLIAATRAVERRDRERRETSGAIDGLAAAREPGAIDGDSGAPEPAAEGDDDA